MNKRRGISLRSLDNWQERRQKEIAQADMKAIKLTGHERPLTQVKYNKEGDLLFSCSKIARPVFGIR